MKYHIDRIINKLKKAFNKYYLLLFVPVLLPAILLLIKVMPGSSHELIDKNIKAVKISGRILMLELGNESIAAVLTGKGIVVVDAGISASIAAGYKRVIVDKFNNNDFACLINTHSHWDHTTGNQAFSDIDIIGHENCIEEMTDYWENKSKIIYGVQKIINDYNNQLKNFEPEWMDSTEINLQIIRFQQTYEDLKNSHEVTVPNRTFADTLNFSLGDVTFNLIYFGKAHSGSDILIYIPEEKVLMVGDLFSEFGRPMIDEANYKYADQWAPALGWLSDKLDNIEIVLGGHGRLMNKNDLIGFMQFIEEKQEEMK